MLRCRHRTLVIIAGASWLLIGLTLLYLGLKRVTNAEELVRTGNTGANVLTEFLMRVSGGGNAGFFALAALALGLGYVKGRFILSRTMRRILTHIHALPNPAPLTRLYGFRYLILVAAMIGLSACLRALHAPDDIRGVVLAAVGVGLVRASTLAFRAVPTFARPRPASR